MNYYERHLGDYARDTAHLSLLEHGVYTILLDAYYGREKPLPADLKECCKLARAASKAERDAVAYILREFFVQTDDGYRQARADSEIERFRDKQRKASASANARWDKSKGNANASPSAMRPHSVGNALQTPVTSHQSPEGSLRSPSEARVDWEAEREWALDELRSVYPSNLHTDAEWESAARVIAGRIASGEVTREALHLLTLQFAAQQDAKKSRNSQYVESPIKHFDGRGKWRGPFNLPATKAQQQQDANVSAGLKWLAQGTA